jgi:hypothetical protein
VIIRSVRKPSGIGAAGVADDNLEFSVKKVPEPGPASVKRPISKAVFCPFSGSNDKKVADPLGSIEQFGMEARKTGWP